MLTSLSTPAFASHRYDVCIEHCRLIGCGTGVPGTICGCLLDVEGGGHCSNDFVCGSTEACAKSSDCVAAHGAGWFCQPAPGAGCTGICGQVCVPPCGTATGAGTGASTNLG